MTALLLPRPARQPGGTSHPVLQRRPWRPVGSRDWHMETQSAPASELGLDPGSQHTGSSGGLGKTLGPSTMAMGPAEAQVRRACVCVCVRAHVGLPPWAESRQSQLEGGGSEGCGWRVPWLPSFLEAAQHPGLWPSAQRPRAAEGSVLNFRQGSPPQRRQSNTGLAWWEQSAW